MTITIIGFISIIATVLGLSWKMWTHIRNVEIHITNHLEHKLERIEDKIDKLNDKISNF